MELVVLQKKLRGISSEFNIRLEQESRSNNEVTDDLTSKVIEAR
jgi:hypothetical protein